MQGCCPCLSYPVPSGAALGQRSAVRLCKLFLASKPFLTEEISDESSLCGPDGELPGFGRGEGPALLGCLLLGLPGLSLKANPSEKPAQITCLMTPSGASAPTALWSTKPPPDQQH